MKNLKKQKTKKQKKKTKISKSIADGRDYEEDWEVVPVKKIERKEKKTFFADKTKNRLDKTLKKKNKQNFSLRNQM